MLLHRDRQVKAVHRKTECAITAAVREETVTVSDRTEVRDHRVTVPEDHHVRVKAEVQDHRVMAREDQAPDSVREDRQETARVVRRDRQAKAEVQDHRAMVREDQAPDSAREDRQAMARVVRKAEMADRKEDRTDALAAETVRVVPDSVRERREMMIWLSHQS